MPFDHPLSLLLLVFLLAAVLVDQRQHRVPNALTGLMLIAGIAVQIWIDGGQGALDALSGAGIGLGLFLVPYAMRSLGAGDVKLMAAVGAWLGPAATVAAAAVTLVVGAGFGLLVLTYRYYRSSAVAEELLASRFPYAAAIAVGVAVTLSAKEISWLL